MARGLVWVAVASACLVARAEETQQGSGDVDGRLLAPTPPPRPSELRKVQRLTLREVVHPQEPVLISNKQLRETAADLHLDSFAALRGAFGEVPVVLGEEFWVWEAEGGRSHNFSKNQISKFADYLDDLQSEGDERAPAARLSAIGGVDFFRRHPAMSKRLYEAFQLLIPRYVRTPFRDAKYDGNWMHAWKDWSDLMLWAAAGGFVYNIHQDYVTGSILFHIDGPKRILLYPPEQHESLYLYNDDNGEVYEANSLVPTAVQKGERSVPSHFSKFAQARPVEVRLQPGDAVFLPCEWAHQVWYDGPAISVSFNFGASSPEGCSDLIPGAVDRTLSYEEYIEVSSQEPGLSSQAIDDGRPRARTEL